MRWLRARGEGQRMNSGSPGTSVCCQQGGRGVPDSSAALPPSSRPHTHLEMSSMMSSRQGRCQAGYTTHRMASRHVVATRSVTMSKTAQRSGRDSRAAKRSMRAAQQGTTSGGCEAVGRCRQRAAGKAGQQLQLRCAEADAACHLLAETDVSTPAGALTCTKGGGLAKLAGEAAVQLVAHKRGKVGEHGGGGVAESHAKGIDGGCYSRIAWQGGWYRGKGAG